MADRKWRENNVKTDEDVWDRSGDLEGELVKIEQNVGPNESTLYTIHVDNGSTDVRDVKVWGSTVLDDRFLGVPQGTYVKVTYEGLKKGKNGKSYHNYKVFIDDATPVKPQKVLDTVVPVDDKPVDLKDIPF